MDSVNRIIKTRTDVSRGNLVGSECNGERSPEMRQTTEGWRKCGQGFRTFLGRRAAVVGHSEEEREHRGNRRHRTTLQHFAIKIQIFNCIAPTTPASKLANFTLESPFLENRLYHWLSCSNAHLHLATQAKHFLSLYSFFVLLPDVVHGRQTRRLATTSCVSTVPTMNTFVEFIPWTNTLIAGEYSDCSPIYDVDEQSACWQFPSLL